MAKVTVLNWQNIKPCYIFMATQSMNAVNKCCESFLTGYKKSLARNVL